MSEIIKSESNEKPFEQLVSESCIALSKSGKWMDAGVIVLQSGKLGIDPKKYSYKIQEVKMTKKEKKEFLEKKNNEGKQ